MSIIKLNSLTLDVPKLLAHGLLFRDLIGRDSVGRGVDKHDHWQQRSAEKSKRHAAENISTMSNAE